MKIKPVKQAKTPNYPILDYYIKNPGLLSKNIPDSWIRNKYVTTSLATFILFGTPKAKIYANQNGTEILEKLRSESKDQTKDEIKDSIKIAPIFAHGDGSGATGCIVMSPPVFISEDEARSIIFNALEAEGIKFDTIDCPEITFKSNPIANDCYVGDDDTTKVPDANVELKMDGYNKELNLAIQFVSRVDYFKFSSDDGCFSSVQEYDTKKAAEIIRGELITNGKTNAVVFYDPITAIDFDSNKNWKENQKEAKEEAEKLLLAQVEDFIKWIRKENSVKE
jgi:hypothetical protein